MLDPLLTPEQKKAQEENATAEKSQKEASSTDAPSTANAGFDAMMNPTATPENKIEEVHPDHAAIDAVSFDIGGVDMPGVDGGATSDTPATSVGGGFLSGGTAAPMSDSAVPDLGMDFSLDAATPPTDMSTVTLDSSIALVQGATAVSSDAIVGGADSAIEIHAEEDVHPDEVALIVATADHPPETNNNTITSPISDMTTAPTLEAPQATDTAGGIFDLLGSTPSPDIQVVSTEPVSSTPVAQDSAPVFAFDTATSPETASVTVEADDIGVIDFDSTHLDARDSLPTVKTEDVVARIAPSHELDASLQEMLQEFVTKLEKFKRENGDVDTEMQEHLASVAQARKDLEEEHRVRLLALDYQEKAIREKGEKKIAEERAVKQSQSTAITLVMLALRPVRSSALS